MIFLKILQTFRGKHLCMSLFFNKEETLAQVFSCEFCKIFKNTSLTEHLGMTASGFNRALKTNSRSAHFVSPASGIFSYTP